jgi:hypothetical protein
MQAISKSFEILNFESKQGLRKIVAAALPKVRLTTFKPKVVQCISLKIK